MIKKIFIVHHTHVDIGYTEPQTAVFENQARFIDQVLDYCRKTDGYPEGSKFKWTCEVSWTVKNYFERRPERIKEFITRVNEGRIEVTGLYLNGTELFTVEELIRSFYFAKELEKRYGIEVISAMNSDIPGLSWIIPQILAKFGIRYLSMSTNPIRSFTPKVPFPFYWISPNGSKVLTWNTESKSPESCWYSMGYTLGFADSYEKVSRFLPDYINHLEQEKYPYDAQCLRMGRDNLFPHFQLSKIVKEWNKKHNSPEVIISLNKEFFQYMEKKYKDKFPSYKLAWPDPWADGNASGAYETGLSRDTHRELITVEKLASILSSLKEDYPEERIKKIWDNISFFDEHTWGANESIDKPYSFQTKAQWAIKSSFLYQAAAETKTLLGKSPTTLWKFPGGIERGQTHLPLTIATTDWQLDKLGRHIRVSRGKRFGLFNPLPWGRKDIAVLKFSPEELEETGGFQIKTEGKNLSYQMDRDKGKVEISFLAENILPLGYQTFEVIPGKSPLSKSNFSFTKQSIENNFFRIIFDPITGGIKSIKDKELKIELIDQKSPYKFNQYIYEEITSKKGRDAIYDLFSFAVGKDKKKGARFRRSSPEFSQIKKGKDGSFRGSIIVETEAKGCPKIIHEVTLYHNFKRIDIANTLFKEATVNPESIYYAFPFNFKNPEAKFEIAGAVMRPEVDQLPATARDHYSIQDWVSVSGKDFGIVWVSRETPLVQFGRINTGKWTNGKLKVENGTIFSWLMNNHWWTNFKASQGGELSFHYSLASIKGKIDNSKASLFAQEYNNPLLAFPLSQNLKGALPEEEWSFCSLDKKNVALLALKKSEDGKGIIIRLQEIDGKDSIVSLNFPYYYISKAFLTTIAEEKIRPLPVHKNKVEVPLNKFEIVTIKIAKENGRKTNS